MIVVIAAVYTLLLLAVTMMNISSIRNINRRCFELNEREALIEQHEAVYEANKKEVECVISFLVKELNEKDPNHDK